METYEIESMLRDKGVWSHVYNDFDEIVVEIRWGDWKHDHLRTKFIMDELGYRQVSEEVTEEDGSDTYSSIHRYSKV